MALDADELILFRKTLRHVIDSNEPQAVPAELIEQGWLDLTDADPAAAVTALCEEAGAARSSAPVVDLAILLGVDRAADVETAVVFDGMALAGVERASRFLCVAEDGLSEAPAEGAEFEPAGGFDPALGLQRVVMAEAKPFGDGNTIERAIAAGRRALASQMVGAAEQMLVDTLAYVSERRQYGRAIGAFQSVKHRLADVKVATTAARAGVETAWTYADGPDGAVLAMAAKCLAGRAQHLASTHCFQVHGGIAFAVEHGFQQWVRRGLLLDVLLGSHVQLTEALGRRLIARRGVPRVPNLY